MGSVIWSADGISSSRNEGVSGGLWVEEGEIRVVVSVSSSSSDEE